MNYLIIISFRRILVLITIPQSPAPALLPQSAAATQHARQSVRACTLSARASRPSRCSLCSYFLCNLSRPWYVKIVNVTSAWFCIANDLAAAAAQFRSLPARKQQGPGPPHDQPYLNWPAAPACPMPGARCERQPALPALSTWMLTTVTLPSTWS